MSPEVNPLVFKSDTKLLLEKAKVKVYSAFPVFFFVFFCFLFYFFCFGCLYYSARVENAFACDVEIGRLCEFICTIHQKSF